jgi:hypothetical protein
LISSITHKNNDKNMHIQMDKFAKLDYILLYNTVELLIIQNVMEIPLTMKRMTDVGNLELTKLVQL